MTKGTVAKVKLSDGAKTVNDFNYLGHDRLIGSDGSEPAVTA